jgi:hypothetical protein
MTDLSELQISASSPTISYRLRIPAIAGFIGIVCFITAFILFPSISDALNYTAIDHGLTELASHPTLALVCQQLFAVADIAFIIFLFGLASLAQPRYRPLAWLGSFLYSISFALDLIVVAAVLAVTTFIAPRAAQDPILHASGTAILGFASVIDFRESFLWTTASVLLGVAAWQGRHWPRWLAGAAILNGILSAPYLPLFASLVLGNIVFAIWVLGMSVTLWQCKVRP